MIGSLPAGLPQLEPQKVNIFAIIVAIMIATAITTIIAIISTIIASIAITLPPIFACWTATLWVERVIITGNIVMIIAVIDITVAISVTMAIVEKSIVTLIDILLGYQTNAAKHV